MDLIPTTHGNVGYELLHEAEAGPLVLVLPGLGPPSGIKDVLPANHTVAGFAIPAFGGPTVTDYRPGAISEAFDEALQQRFPDRPTILLAVSLGAAFALGMTSRQIVAVVAVEPFLSSDRFELQEMARARFLPHRPDLLPLFRAALGYGGEPVEYPILNKAPLTVLAGDGEDVPHAGSLPSFCTARDRDALREAGATVISARGRHDLLASDPRAVKTAIEAALAVHSQHQRRCG